MANDLMEFASDVHISLATTAKTKDGFVLHMGVCPHWNGRLIFLGGKIRIQYQNVNVSLTDATNTQPAVRSRRTVTRECEVGITEKGERENANSNQF